MLYILILALREAAKEAIVLKELLELLIRVKC